MTLKAIRFQTMFLRTQVSKNSEVDQFNLAVGRALMFFRSKAGLTRKQVCEELGITASRYLNWEVGQGGVSLFYALLCCKLFKITIEVLLNRMMEE